MTYVRTSRGVNPTLGLVNWSKATPVQNTWYTAADLYKVDIFGVKFSVGVANETIEMRFTIDGVEYDMAGVAATFGTYYHPYLSDNYVETSGTTMFSFGKRYASVKAYHCKIEIRKTTATGAGTLYCVVNYAQN